MSEVFQSRRKCLYDLLETAAWPQSGLSPLNKFVVALICLATLVAILESEPLLYVGREKIFFAFEIVFTIIFGAEYAARLWVAGEDERYRGFTGRPHFTKTPTALIDLLALLPVFLIFLGSEVFLLRIVRLLRILRVARLGRFSRAFDAISAAVSARRYELLMSFGIATVLLIASSTLLYIVEGQGQPETFGSIPRAMWWSVATLTTVGHGDVYPMTAIGRVFAGLTAITGIGVIAMPTGILASGFSDALQQGRR